MRSPLLNINRACQVCHSFSEAELAARANAIQQRNFGLLQRAGAALMDQLDAMAAARAAGAEDDDYEALAFGSRWLGKLSIAPRIRVLLGVLLTLCAHFVEVVLFAVG